MDVENDNSIYIDPEIIIKELVISLPVLTESDVEMILNNVDYFDDESSVDEDEKEKPCLKRDQRRLNLLNNPDYGIILGFIEKFRSYIKMKNYPLRILEDNLICEKEKLSGRFIDFHLALLRKVTSGKLLKRDQFVPSIAKFADRFNHDDGDYLNEHGYSKSNVEIKLRVLKNLLEKQFDCDQTLKTFVANNPSHEIRSKPFGRDRFGASYWLFMDTECFMRVFRENIDNKHTWINVAKNQTELENLIKLLITDHIIRKKFPEWKFSYESFNCLSSSNEFEERYSFNLSDNKPKNELLDELCSSLVLLHSDIVKTDDVDFDPVVNLNRDLPSSPPILSPFKIDDVEKKDDMDVTSDNESGNSSEINPNRLSISSSINARDDTYSGDYSDDSIYNNVNYSYKYEDIENTSSSFHDQHITSKNDNDSVQAIVLKPLLEQGIKRKLVDYDDSESDAEDNEKHDEVSQDSHQIPDKKDSTNNVELPIALRRSKRGRRSRLAELSPASSNASKSASRSSRTKKSVDEGWKSPTQSSKTNGRRQRKGRRGKTSMNDHSSSTSDENPLYNDDDFSDDYLPDKSEVDELLTGNLLEEDNDEDSISNRKAKTVAQCHEQFQRPLTSCSICLQNNHPESLLLCEDCDDAYHLECLKPELLSIPNDSWYCPLCEHKRLCDGLVEKLLILIKDQEDFEMKRRLYVSKRRKRLTNVAVNLDRYVKQPTNEHKTNGIVSRDEKDEEEEEEEQEIKKKTNSTNNNNHNNDNNKEEDDDDDDSVYGRKNDENRKPSDQEQEQEQTGKRRVRSCRRKAQNYSFDDYDKKMKEAMIDAGINKDLIDNDSDDSDEIIIKRKQPGKRRRYEFDDDFDASNSKHNDEYLPSRRRTINSDSRSEARDNDSLLSYRRPTMNDDSRSARDYDDFLSNRHPPTINEDSRNARDYDDIRPNRQPTFNDDSRSDARDYDDNDDFGMSDDDRAWKSQPQSSTSSKPKKKSNAKKPNRNNQRKSTIRSEEDSILSEANLNNLPSGIKIKTEPTTEFDQNIIGTNETAKNTFDKRPVVNNSFDQTPTTNKSVNKTPVVENATDKNEASKAPKRRQRRTVTTKKKPSIQPEKFSDEEENGHPPVPARRPYRRRRISHESSIDEDDDYEKLAHKRRLFSQGKGITRTSITDHIKKLVGDEDDDEEQEENEEDETKVKNSNGTKKNGNSKQKNKNSQYEEYQLSDDDDFPDEQEILKTTGLNLKKPSNIPKAAPYRAPCTPSMLSYQFIMADPTANFDLTCLPETPMTEPSDTNQANGNHGLSTST
ncbi:unnamed protein product [Rotaria sp. Silwood1]|nr:unnamed protein product [Rotaria sp. Silwood1]CAF4560759.1 unnamed protein product [Rotaria sp. Silwood1]